MQRTVSRFFRFNKRHKSEPPAEGSKCPATNTFSQIYSPAAGAVSGRRQPQQQAAAAATTTTTATTTSTTRVWWGRSRGANGKQQNFSHTGPTSPPTCSTYNPLTRLRGVRTGLLITTQYSAFARLWCGVVVTGSGSVVRCGLLARAKASTPAWALSAENTCNLIAGGIPGIAVALRRSAHVGQRC